MKFFKSLLILIGISGQFFINAHAQLEAQTPAQQPEAIPSTSSMQITLPVMQPQVIGKNEIIFSQKAYPINSIDPNVVTNAAGSFYPGLRGANQLIIYTPMYGPRTNTNEFGTEAIVKGTTVTTISGADSLIPSDGIVISGHGSAKKWINENIILGSKIYVDAMNKNLNVYITSDSFIYSAKEKIKEAQELTDYYKLYSYSYNWEKPTHHIEKAEEYLHKAEREPQNVQKYSSLAIESANAALATAIPYKSDELKGVWIRPTETSHEQIESTLNRIHSKGINAIFLETYYHGKTIFPSKTMENYQFTVQNEKFAGFDPLKVWIEEAHKRNIKVNIWFETFYVGNNAPSSNPQSILAVNPNWANTTKRDYASGAPTPSLSEHNGYFIDPANPDVQDFLAELLTEIIQNYKPDGINLDYIRYPQSIAAKFPSYDLSNWGYTEYARDEFKKLCGVDPVELTPSDPLWPAWCKYRQDKITQFVKRISCLTKQNNIMLTTVIFPDRQKALETKQQDWRSWSAMDLINGFTPLLLTCDPKTASAMMMDVTRNKCPNTDLYAGLFVTFMEGANEDLIRQIHEARKLNTKGIIIFDYAHLSDKYANTLTQSVFSQTAPIQVCTQPTKIEPKKIKKKRKLFKRGE